MNKEIEVVNQESKRVSLFRRYFKDENGATAVEYGLLVGLIAVVIITAVTTLGSAVSRKFDETQCKISGKTWNATNNTCS